MDGVMVVGEEGKARFQETRRVLGRRMVDGRVSEAVVATSVGRILEANQSDDNPTLTVAAFQSSI